MRSAADELRRAAHRLRQELNVDAGLDGAIQDLEGPPGSADLLSAQRAVGERIRALQAGGEQLRQLLNTLTDLRTVVRFTPEGWPQERARLQAAFGADPLAGLAEWLDACCQALAELRIDALQRLTSAQLPFPVGAHLLVERFATAGRALAGRKWQVVIPVLSAAAAGLVLGEHELPGPETRVAMVLAQARMEVDLGGDPGPSLEAARRLGAAPAESAVVLAWAARRDGDGARAAAHFADARGGFSPAILTEAVHQARQSSSEAGLSAARGGVARLPGIADVASQLYRLVGPIPPEVWLAVAERAVTEQDRQLAGQALDEAERAAGNDHPLLALIFELRADLAGDGQGGDADRTAALRAAADHRWSADQPEIARAHYQSALQLAPGDGEIELRLAGLEAGAQLAQAGGGSAQGLATSLARLESIQDRQGVDAASAWSLLTAAQLHSQLAQVGEDSSAKHLWRALLALARALALDASDPELWAQLATTLDGFGLFQVGLLAARRAQELAGKDPSPTVIEAVITTTANLGDFEAAQSLPKDRSTPWAQGVAGFVAWRQGQRTSALEQLRLACLAEPNLLWVRTLLIRAYVLTGDMETARQQAAEVTTQLGSRRDSDALALLGQAALVLGDFGAAQDLGVELESRNTFDEGAGLALSGQAKLLAGRSEGLDDLVRAVGRARTRRSLADWQTIDQPVLEALAAQIGMALPALEPLRVAMAVREATLASWADPLVELADLADGPLATPEAGQARAFFNVLLREAQGDVARARAALGAGQELAGDVAQWRALVDRILSKCVADALSRNSLEEAVQLEGERLAATDQPASAGRIPEIALLLAGAGAGDQARLAIEAARHRAGDLPELARAEGIVAWRAGRPDQAVQVWQASRAKGGGDLDALLAAARSRVDQAEAVVLLRAALERSYGQTAKDLRSLALGPDDLAVLNAVLERLSVEPSSAPGAFVVAQVLAQPPGEAASLPLNALEVHLPPSWFASMEHPVAESPLLARFIPEARLRLPWTLPGVQARDDATLKPGGYRILVLGALAEQDQVPVDAYYLPPASLTLLSAPIRQLASDAKWGQFSVLKPPEAPLTGVDALLLEPAAEVVARRIEAVALTYQVALKQFWAERGFN